jgi:ERCC4-related helicase
MVRSIQAERGSSLADETESRFPTGKLVFLMPTKPLVTQQHEACQNSCGIPSADTATVTGDDPEKWRDEAVSMMGS